MTNNANIFNFRKKTLSYTYTKNSNKLLSFTLMWFGLAISLVLLFALSVTFNEGLRNIFINFISSSDIGITSFWIIGSLLQFVLVFLINYLVNKNKSLFSIVFAFLIFVLIESFIVSFIFLIYSGNSIEFGRNILLALLIPFGILIFMGILGYFKIFNFSKLVPILTFGTFTLIIIGVLFWWIFSDILVSIYSVLGILIFSGWIGFDLYVIRKTNDHMVNTDNYSNLDFLKISIIFALKLFIDFINLVLFALRFFRR
ncbi:Bax inhibitor-1/YccA family protein [[Mycoplasma] mobile]|uniref:Conserved hypothetical membrane protein n=1 Tax=Mycoplasma mobile (strain ATCC 43663 / 163K / NCTC 11711) TaxID=267748 RepID=Q6KHK1_MYCM1|nr:Bax inhibitor-1 family protein [[Mycoplasma] mobile]AAT27929.1 conserved hypothetical membrane protein [Mycoplasma mobile 163K]